MKKALLITAVALGLLAGPAFAQTSAENAGIGGSTLSDDQRDALIAILSGLPRQ